MSMLLLLLLLLVVVVVIKLMGLLLMLLLGMTSWKGKKPAQERERGPSHEKGIAKRLGPRAKQRGLAKANGVRHRTREASRHLQSKTNQNTTQKRCMVVPALFFLHPHAHTPTHRHTQTPPSHTDTHRHTQTHTLFPFECGQTVTILPE